MTTVAVLGATGMLGAAVLTEFSGFSGQVVATARDMSLIDNSERYTVTEFDTDRDLLGEVFPHLGAGDFIINCIGIIKTEIDENSVESCNRAQRVNAAFPAKLATFAESRQIKVIQIATDCVFSGKDGPYSESSLHDPEDVYGKSKSAGEIKSPAMMHLRVSIIGTEKRRFTSLYEWVVRQPFGAKITGYTNHLWNGIPAKHFGKIARAMVEQGIFTPGVQHLVPADTVSKANLVHLIADHGGRNDIQITDGSAPKPINRTLSTLAPEYSAGLWRAAGYSTPPTIEQLVREI